MYRAAALDDRTGNGAVRKGSEMEFSLYTLACPGLPLGESVGVCSCLCFDGGTPSEAMIRRSFWGGEGVDRDSGLLL